MSHFRIGGETPAPTGSVPRPRSRTDEIRSLTQVMEEARPTLDRFDTYFGGTQPLQFLSPEVKEAVQGRLHSLVINWPRLVVGAVEERLDVEGFRVAPEAPADSDLWRIWQANSLDEASQQAHSEALIHGRAFVIVWASADPSTPRVTVESAKQVYVSHAVGSRRRTRALKKWVDDGYAFATLYEPDEITRWRSVSRAPDSGDASYVPSGGWALQESIPNPLGVVPVIPMVNRPRLMIPDGESELADVLPICDAVNKLATDMLVSSEYHAMPRRFATGIDIAEDAEGQPVQQFSPVAGRTWIAEDPESKFGQFPEANLDGFIHGIEMLTQQLSSITGIPPHYLNILKGQLTSAESIRSAEASLVAKARRKQRGFGGSWEDVMRLALQVRDGVAPQGLEGMETIWRDPETRTVAQAADAAQKKKDLGVPLEQLLEDLGYTQTQITRIREMRRREALDSVVVDPEKLLP